MLLYMEIAKVHRRENDKVEGEAHGAWEDIYSFFAVTQGYTATKQQTAHFSSESVQTVAASADLNTLCIRVTLL